MDDYRLTGEIVAIPAGPLAYETVRRSAEYATPAAAGAPAICLVPAPGVQNIVYRDTAGRLHELWRDAAGQTGTTNLTGAAVGAPTSSGAPASYADTAAGQQVEVYRGDDGTSTVSTGPPARWATTISPARSARRSRFTDRLTRRGRMPHDLRFSS